MGAKFSTHILQSRGYRKDLPPKYLLSSVSAPTGKCKGKGLMVRVMRKKFKDTHTLDGCRMKRTW